jgi:putative flippase GtrA
VGGTATRRPAHLFPICINNWSIAINQTVLETNVPTEQLSPRPAVRYAAVTALATPTNFAMYALLLAATSWPAVVSNLVAASIVSVPTYFANRILVWRSTGSVARQAAAYWVTTVVNVAIASAVVWTGSALQASDHTLVAIPLATYTVLWLARFFVLDRFVFNH